MTSTAIGQWGEQFTADYLKTQNGHILFQQWRCRQGEIDLIARMGITPTQRESCLAFIEVKTRSLGNWDQGGALAVNPSKQHRIIQTAQYFLAKYPAFGDLPCRFDVALVHYAPSGSQKNRLMGLYSRQNWHGYDWQLQDYLIAAFEAN